MKKTAKPKYRRILLKLSGEALGGESGFGINAQEIQSMAEQVREVRDLGVQVVIVLGGGNIFRGLAGSEKGIERATGDYMGMLATVINSLALQDRLEKLAALRQRRGEQAGQVACIDACVELVRLGKRHRALRRFANPRTRLGPGFTPPAGWPPPAD